MYKSISIKYLLTTDTFIFKSIPIFCIQILVVINLKIHFDPVQRTKNMLETHE